MNHSLGHSLLISEDTSNHADSINHSVKPFTAKESYGSISQVRALNISN